MLAFGLPDGRGLALKVRDGSLRAVPPAGVALARSALGLRAAVPDELVAAPIVNSRGVRVGELRVDPHTRLRQPVLQRALDARVQRVEAVERQRLG